MSHEDLVTIIKNEEGLFSIDYMDSDLQRERVPVDSNDGIKFKKNTIEVVDKVFGDSIAIKKKSILSVLSYHGDSSKVVEGLKRDHNTLQEYSQSKAKSLLFLLGPSLPEKIVMAVFNLSKVEDIYNHLPVDIDKHRKVWSGLITARSEDYLQLLESSSMDKESPEYKKMVKEVKSLAVKEKIESLSSVKELIGFWPPLLYPSHIPLSYFFDEQ